MTLNFSNRYRVVPRRSGRKGFTLVELAIYSGLIALLVFFLSGFTLNVLRMEGKIAAKRQTSQAAKDIINDISLEARRGEKIYLSTSVLSASAGQLSIETKNGLPAGGTYGFVDYYLSAGRLFKKQEGQDPFLLSGTDVVVSEFRIERFGAGGAGEGIKIFLTLSGGSGKYNNTASAEKSIRFRK